MHHSELKGLIFNIQRYTLHDGPGIRMTIFFKGCPLACWWCHNPEGQCGEKVAEAASEKSDYSVSIEELMKEIEKERIFFEESGGGVTFSGGEPLMQIGFLSTILHECKKNNIHTTLDTSGYADEDDLIKIIDQVDLFLYDLKIMDDSEHIKYTGVSNTKILDNLRLLSRKNKNVFIRIPVIPGINDTDKNTIKMIEFLEELGNIKQIHLLPYHRNAEGKYQKDKIKGKTFDIKADQESRINEIKSKFEENRFIVKIGG